MKHLSLIGLVLSLGFAGAAAAQEAPVSADSTPAVALEDVVVEGRPLEDLVRGFVEEVGAPNRRRGLARWTNDVCVGVANMPPEAAQALIDRISEVALDLGLDIGDPGCHPNVLILATADGAGTATELVRARRRAFDVGSLQMDRGTAPLRAFQTSDRPVRWWQISIPTDSETGQRAIRLAGDVDSAGNPTAPKIAVFAASRLRSQIRDDLFRSLIIIDVTRLGDITFGQLADYVTMTALAQIDADGDTTRYSTILNLFDGSAPPAGLTDWDKTYLEALYGSRLDRLNPDHQISAIVRDLTRARREVAREPGE